MALGFWGWMAIMGAQSAWEPIMDAITGEKDLPGAQLAAQEAQAKNLRQVRGQLAKREKRTQGLRKQQGRLIDEASRFGGSVELSRMMPGIGRGPGTEPLPEEANDPRAMASINGAVNPLLLSIIEANMGPRETGMEDLNALI